MTRVALAKVTRKGQMTIPQELREILEVEPGDYVALRPLLGGVFMSKAHVTPKVKAEEVMRYVAAALAKEGEAQGMTGDKDLDAILEMLGEEAANNALAGRDGTEG